jgi:sensor c-di-GMP phosphodiesterase-like protein
VITPKNRQIRSLRGDIQLDWLDRVTDEPTVTFIDDGHIVAIAKSSKLPTITMVAAPIHHMQSRIVNIALLLTPIGLVTGLALLWTTLRVIRQQSSMPAIIKEALQEREFFLVYQPIVDLTTGEWIGVEALIRWKRPSGEFIRPDLFIPVAEDNGLIQKITAQVIEMLADDLPEILKRKPDCHVGINLSANDMQTEDALKLLKAVSDDTGIPSGALTVEVTERGIANSEEARSIVRDFRSEGIRVAVDDFGTGYSSLSYLETFELDYLKIDKSFVDKIGTHSAASHVVLHIIEMSKGLNLEMIAEGIETEDQARFLRDQGVQYGQGWLFSKPLSLNDLLLGLSGSKPDPAAAVA